MHIQAFKLKLSRSRSVACGAHIQAFTQKLAEVLDSFVHAGNTRAVGTSTRADACACAGDPQPRLFEFTSCDTQSTAQKPPCVNTFFEAIVEKKLRVVLQELEQDDNEVVTPRPETQHCGHEQKQKHKFGQKGLLTKEKKRGDFLLQEYFPRGIYFYYSLNLIPRNRRRVKLQALQFYINFKTIGL